LQIQWTYLEFRIFIHDDFPAFRTPPCAIKYLTFAPGPSDTVWKPAVYTFRIANPNLGPLPSPANLSAS
jgi:hypothetical protein